MKKITILHYSIGGTGGLSNVSSTLANYWSEQGHEVTRIGITSPLIESPYKINTNVNEFNVLKTKEVNTNKISFSFKFLWTIATTVFPINLLKKKKLNKFLDTQDVILIQNPLIIKWLAKRNKNKCTLFIHQQYGALMKKILKFNKISIRKKVSNLVSLDPKTEEILKSILKPEKSIWLPNFIGKEAYPINPKRKDVVFVGRISHDKNIPWILSLAKQYPNEDFMLYGGIEPNYQKTWDSLEKPKNIFYKGRTNNPIEVFSNAKISLHTGRVEGYSLSMIEAACSGNLLLAYESWDTKDPMLKKIIFKTTQVDEFISYYKKIDSIKLPTKEEVMKLRKYYSFESYVQKVEKVIFD